MTNREWLAQNPEQITGDLAEEILFNYHQQHENLFFSEYIENYLNAEHEQPECTVIMTFEVTEIFLRDVDEIDEERVAAELAENIKTLLNADNVTAAKVQIFKRGFDK